MLFNVGYFYLLVGYPLTEKYMQHKITKLPDWVLPDDESYLNELGKDGWELVHIYNQHAYMKAAAGGTIASGALATNVDAFGRLRVTDTFTLGDYKHLYAIDENFINYNISGSSSTFNVNRASVTLQTSASAASRAVHQTKMYHNYMPGKSQLILSSVKFGAAESGVIKRTGYFDDYNGIFLEQDQTGSLQFVIRSSTNGTGSIQENRVKQENWNVNTLLDGDAVLDMSKVQLFWTDFQWLGIGRVRCGVVIKGAFILCHVFDHSNYTNVVYMSTPNLPVRCEIKNTTTATGSMEQICSSVMSEGGYEESGTSWGHATPSLRPIAGNTTALLMAIRLKTSYNGLPNRAYVRLEDTSVYSDDQTIKYSVVRMSSGSVTGGTWTSVDNSSVVEFNTGSMGYTASLNHELLNGFTAAGTAGGGGGAGTGFSSTSQRAGSKNRINYIAQNFDSTNSDMYGIVVTNLTGTSTDVGVGMVWKEVY
jgi:hypothetical protein